MLAKRRQLLTAATNKAYWMFKYIKFLSHAGEQRRFLLVNTKIHHEAQPSPQRAAAAPPTAVLRPSLAADQHVLATPRYPASARRSRAALPLRGDPSTPKGAPYPSSSGCNTPTTRPDAGAPADEANWKAIAIERKNRCFSSAMFVPRCENSCRANQRHLPPRGRNPRGRTPRNSTLAPPGHKGESGQRVTAGHGVKCRTRG